MATMGSGASDRRREQLCGDEERRERRGGPRPRAAGERQGDCDEPEHDRLDDRHALQRPHDGGCRFPRAVRGRDAEAVEPARARHRRG